MSEVWMEMFNFDEFDDGQNNNLKIDLSNTFFFKLGNRPIKLCEKNIHIFHL